MTSPGLHYCVGLTTCVKVRCIPTLILKDIYMVINASMKQFDTKTKQPFTLTGKLYGSITYVGVAVDHLHPVNSCDHPPPQTQ